MNGVLDVVADLRALLEPDEQVAVDETGAEPQVLEDDTFYCYHTRLAEVPFETGPTARQDFSVMAVFVTGSSEDALRRSDPEISALLDDRRARYLDAVRRNRSTTTWHHIAATERPAPKTLTTRSIALEISGYRFVGG